MGDLPMFQFENFNLIAGIVLAGVTGAIILGGLIRIAKVSEWLGSFNEFFIFWFSVDCIDIEF